MKDDLHAFDLDDAAARLKVTKKVIYTMEKLGQIRLLRLGRKPVVPASEMRRLLDGEGRVEGRRFSRTRKIKLFPMVAR